MKKKKALKTVVEEVIANGIGWVAGLLSINLLDNFFIEHRWWQVWHIFSGKTRIAPALFSFLEWTLTAIIGFTVMILVNKFVKNNFLKKKAVAAVTGITNKLNKSKEEEVVETDIVNPALEESTDADHSIIKNYDNTSLNTDENDDNNLISKE